LQRNTAQGAAAALAKNQRCIWKKIVSILACVVAVSTTCALILPAATLEETPQCGKPEHTHTDACYTQETAGSSIALVCTLESLGLHEHTAACLDENGEYRCGYSDFVVHEHDDACFDADGNLWCLLPEVAAHVHNEDCYAQPETKPVHTHTDECYTTQRGDLVCTIPEGDGAHTHSVEAGCYDEIYALACPLEESAGHQHTDDCYAQSKVLTCQLSTEPEEPAGPQLICGREEIILHEHHSDCYDENGALICGKQQVLEHVHTEACLQTVETTVKALICELEEHTHTAACPVIGLIGTLPDQQSVEEQMAAFEEAGDEAGSGSYLTELQTLVQEACEAYAALPEEEQAKVTNLDRLTALEWLQGLSLQEAAVTVTGDSDTSATVAAWTDSTGNARKHLQAALVSVDQGYTIQSVEYYQISNLAGSKAAVAFRDDGGLSAANGAKVFVYDLGTDGLAAPQRCEVENASQTDEKFTFFNFTIPAESGSESHVYAFASAVTSTLEELGIYLGKQQDDGTWVAYDAASEAAAGVRATITLPENVTAPDGYKPFIRKINPGEGYYPSDEAVSAKAGTFNGWQCYTIRWLKQDDTGLHMLPLNNGGSTVTVEIDYLNDAAQLPGPAGARKLLIYNSNTDGSLVDQVADTVENVQVANDSYTSFTFQAAQAGPYVFVSKKVEMGYIRSLQIAKIIDGSAPFDSTGDLDSNGEVDKPGNDSGDSNGVVRSYDTIQYNLEATFGARQDGVSADEINMYFELTLKKSATAAKFDVDNMHWLGNNYSIEYLDADGDVIMILDHDGKYYLPQTDGNGTVIRDANGFAHADTSKPVSMNAQVNGSDAGENSYKVVTGGVAMQRLVGRTTLTSKEEQSVLNGTQNFTAAVQVRNADNGEVFSPTFKLWLEGNEENYGSEGTAGTTMSPAQPVKENEVTAENVTVSAGTDFNVQLKKNTNLSYLDWFDFSTGQAVDAETRAELEELANLEENHDKSNPTEFTNKGAALSDEKKSEYANYRYGRLSCYGITLQLYSDTDNDPEKNRAAKGLKGTSLPVGDISFDLNFSTTVTSGGQSVSGDDYTAILWDYNENIPAHISYTHTYDDPGRGTVKTPKDGLGNGGRNLYWDEYANSSYAKGAAPSNYIAHSDGCYYGGDWALVDESGQKITDINTVASPDKVTGSGGDTTYHFSVSDYDFDFDNQHFPTVDCSNTNNTTGYDTYARCFSAGCVQVLDVFPRVRTKEVEVYLNTTVDNLKLETRDGQELKADDTDNTKIQHEVNREDNTRTDQIVLYSIGTIGKGNSFNGPYYNKNGVLTQPQTVDYGYLGTDYWGTSYDCSAFAGDKIYIIGRGTISATCDYDIQSMNLLQLFDSQALSICGDVDIYQSSGSGTVGTATFLYAADPDYPNGYDTNHQDTDGKYDVVAYMNTVREEDLVYTKDKPDKDGNITVDGETLKCIGVLMEIRHCEISGGHPQYLRIPVEVNDDKELVGKTVATVNTLRVWSYDLETDDGTAISWANGTWNKTNGKNELTGFSKPTNKLEGTKYSGALSNSGGRYTKVEYENGNVVEGTHAGGVAYGNSLLILSYKAGVNIGVDNKGEGPKFTYDLNQGETVVDYRLSNIKTEVSDLTGQEQSPNTNLTIHTVLDEGYTGEGQRISVSNDSYRITGYAVDANGTAAAEESSISIGSDPNNPTTLEFTDPDGNRHRIKVYARLGENNQTVDFVIQDAPVGLELPDITFQADFGAVTALNDNDTIKTSTYISGQGDNRAYDKAKGNADNVTVGIAMGSGTYLTKTVEQRRIELGGVITYHITYTNNGTDRIGKVYFYDLLPHNDDIRGSEFDGKVVLRNVNVTADGTSPANATVYYSTTDYSELYEKVSVFGGSVDGSGEISGMNAEAVEDMLQSGRNSDEEPLFKPLGEVENGEFKYAEDLQTMAGQDVAKLSELMSTVTGLYVKAENLQPKQTVKMEITVQTEGNKANDWYKNFANSWIAGSATLPLTSNKVETQSVGRSISGVVWHDQNKDGVRDNNEPLLQGVTATLFKKDENGEYELCKMDVTGASISPVTTGSDGAYSFDKLAAGDYIVAFSGDALSSTEVTLYHAHQTNDADTNDGKAVTGPSQYAYYICFSADSEAMTLHGIGGGMQLVNGMEAYTHQDLGLIGDVQAMLPATGGVGTAIFYVLGSVLTLGTAALFIIRKRASRTEK